MLNTIRYLLFIIVTILFGHNLTFAETSIVPKAKLGTIDLTDWDFKKDGNLALKGEWEFYWDIFLMDSTNQQNIEAHKTYIQTPQLWNRHSVVMNSNDKHGYASYRLSVLVKTNEKLAIKFLNAATSCEVFIDGTSMFKSGVAAKTKDETKPSYKPAIISFTPKNSIVEIVLQIANFHHKKGGQWEPLILGTEQNIRKYRDRRIFIELFLIGGIFIMSIFHFIIFISHKSDKSSLHFALFTLMIALRLLVTSEFPVYMLGDFNWTLLVRIDYLSFYLTILFFLLFIIELFPKEVNKKANLVLILISLLYSLSSVILTPEYFSYGIISFQIISIIASFYGLHIIFKAIIKKREGALTFLYGFLALFICLIHDTLKMNSVFNSIPWAPYGLTVFVILQANILSSRIRNALFMNKKLSAMLNKQNQENITLNNLYKTQNKQLIHAKERAEESDRFKSAFLANMSHEIRTPMNGIIGFSELLSQKDLTDKEKNEFISIINERSHQLLGIVNDIIDISKIQTGQIDINSDVTCINLMLENLHNTYTHSEKKANVKIIKKLALNNNKSIIITDSIKLKQILDNLLSNALKFTREGEIEFGYELKNSTLEFFVKDSGIGISKKEQELIFGRFIQANKEITQNYGGTGLGLAIAKAYITKLNGRLWLTSEKGKGSTFFFTLPYQPVD